METAKFVRWASVLVTAVVLLVGATAIWSILTRTPQVPVAPVRSVPTELPATASAETGLQRLPDFDAQAPTIKSDITAQTTKPRDRQSHAKRDTDTMAEWAMPGTPRPQTPDSPMNAATDILPNDSNAPVKQPDSNKSAAVSLPPTPRTVTLPAGSTITVSLSEPVSTDQARKGQFFHATLASTLVRDGVVIAQAGSPATGRTLQSKRAGFFGGSPELKLILTDIQMNSRVIHVQTTPYTEIGRSHNLVTSPFRSAFGAMGARHADKLSLPQNTVLQFRLTASVTVTEHVQ